MSGSSQKLRFDALPATSGLPAQRTSSGRPGWIVARLTLKNQYLSRRIEFGLTDLDHKDGSSRLVQPVLGILEIGDFKALIKLEIKRRK